ncbi:MAG: hypothetical protein RB289_02335 [Paludibacter sp.]|jgi:hypothetical protein|nr:hypothetical protein [Paludibacter sp.]
MELTATEKLLKKNFGISSFKQVIAKLEKEPKETFSNNLFVEKDVFIKKIEELNNSINSLSEAYADGLKMAESGSVFETFARRELGNIHTPYVKMRKQLVHHLSYFYKKK